MKRDKAVPGQRVRHAVNDTGPRSRGVILEEPEQQASRHWFVKVQWDSGLVESVFLNRLKEI